MKNNIVASKKPTFLSKIDINYLVGDWCLTEKISKKNYRYKKLKYYGDDKKEIEKKSNFLFKIYLKVLKKFTVALNKYHNVKLTEKYWEILISRWLWHFLMYTHERWEIVKRLKKVKGNFYIKVDNYDEKIFIKKNTRSFIHIAHTPDWNNWIFSKILECNQKFKIIKTNNYYKKVKKEEKKKNEIFKNNFFLNNNNKVFIKNLYINKLSKIKINLAFNQFNPFNFSSPEYQVKDFKISKKRFKFKIFEKKSKNSYLNFLNSIIQVQIPKIFLEGFNEINSKLNYIKWPKNPKVILTSISHLNDDIFKFYIAKKKKEGSKLFVFQHGGGYILDKSSFSHILESRVADKFFTWGCASKIKNIYPLFVSTTAGKRIKKNLNKNGLLIAVYDYAKYPNRLSSYLRTQDSVEKHISDINDLLENLSSQNLKKTKIKFRKDEEGMVSEVLNKKIKKKFRSVKFYDKKLNIYEESAKYELIIETCNSTNLLECISLNIPIVTLWNKNYRVNNLYKKYYANLEKVNVIHKSPKSLAKFINKNKNIDKWWFSKKVQKSVQLFRNNICRFSANPEKELKNIINEAS
jgi:putative transferase (TIGR04331 family)